MSQPSSSPLQRQVARVRRRLFLQLLTQRLVVGWTAAVVLAAAWLVAEPYLRPSLPSAYAAWLRWPAVGTLLGLGLLVAAFQAIRRTPSRLAAALALDERFELRERVTTTLGLSAAERATPAGQALLADVAARVEGLRVGSRFPIRLSWQAALVPAGAVALALLGVFYDPAVAPAKVPPAATDPAVAAADKAEVEKKLASLTPKPRPRKPDEAPKSAKLEQLEADLEKILKQPHDTKDQAREQAKALASIEEGLKKEARREAERQQAVQQQLDRLERLAKDSKAKDEPAKAVEDALAKGRPDKAKEEVDQLRKKVKEDKLSPEEKEQIREQMQDLQEKLERLARKQDEKDELKKLADEGKIDQETLERETEKLDKQSKEKLNDLKDLAERMEKAQRAMENAEGKEGAEKAAADREVAESLERLSEKLGQMDQAGQDLDDMQDQLQRLNEAKDALGKAGRSGNDGTGNSDEDAERLSRGDQGQNGPAGDPGKNGQTSKGGENGQKPGPGGRGRGAGRRPEKKGGPIGDVDARQQGRFDPRGQKSYGGATPGKAFSKKPTAALEGEIQQAVQEAPEAIETQRIPKAARDMAKGFFRNLGEQGDPKKPAPAPAKP